MFLWNMIKLISHSVNSNFIMKIVDEVYVIKKEHSKKILDCAWKMLWLWWISFMNIYGSCLLNTWLCRLIFECCYESWAVSQPPSDRQEKRALHDFTSQKLASLEWNHGRRDLQVILLNQWTSCMWWYVLNWLYVVNRHVSVSDRHYRWKHKIKSD